MNVLGLDLGGVVIDFPQNQPVSKEWLRKHWRELPSVDLRFVGQVCSLFELVWVVSAVPDKEAVQLTQQWLEHVNFWDKTGISRSRLLLCGIAPENKAACVSGLSPKPTVFLDDRPDFLEHMTEVPHRILFDRQEYPNPGTFPTVRNWQEFLELVHQLNES